MKGRVTVMERVVVVGLAAEVGRARAARVVAARRIALVRETTEAVMKVAMARRMGMAVVAQAAKETAATRKVA